MKALILSGGKGTRLRPITFSMAKQLVPVANKPVLFYGIEAVKSAGISDVNIIVGESHSAIEKAVGDGSQFGVRTTYIHQDEPAGLAHAVKIAQPVLQDSPFVMYLGDNIVKSGIKELVDEFKADKPDAMILLAEVPNPSEFGVAELDHGRVIRLEEKPKEPKSNMALVGVYLFSPHIFPAVNAIKPSWRNELEITDAIQYMIDQGLNVRSQIIDGWWKDTGDLQAILDANRLILEDLETDMQGDADASSHLSGRIVIGKGTQLVGATIRGPVVVGANARLINCFIGPFTSIGDNVVVTNSEIEYSIILSDCRIQNVNGRIDHSLLGRGVSISRPLDRPRAHRLMMGDNSAAELY